MVYDVCLQIADSIYQNRSIEFTHLLLEVAKK